jgi:HIV Tat-specific factor 1
MHRAGLKAEGISQKCAFALSPWYSYLSATKLNQLSLSMTASPTEATATTGSDTASKIESSTLINQSFLYQNSKTGNISSAPLKASQLCRILCPVAAVQSLQHLTPETQLLALEADGSYSTLGWKPAKTIPILREAIATWYYQDSAGNAVGPVSCRALATLWLAGEEISNDTLVYSEVCPEWSALHTVPNLPTTLKAFDTAPPIWTNQSQTTSNTMDQQNAAEQGNDSVFTEPQEVDSTNIGEMPQEAHDELEAFLTSTAHMKGHNDDDEHDYDEGYESDGGTKYVKDPRTGNWIHEALAPKREKQKAATVTQNKSVSESTASNTSSQQQPNKKKRKGGAKFAAKNAKCWVYITGLPPDVTVDEVATVFGKAGIIDLDPETQRPKIKLYKHKDGTPLAGQCKGDGSLCFARKESVDLALTLLDESQFRPSVTHTTDSVIRVQRAKFEQHGTKFDDKRARISNDKRKVAKLAAIQAMDWDEGEFNGRLTGGRKGLRIIVLKHMFNPAALAGRPDEDSLLASMEQDLHAECEQWGVVEKITVFSKNPAGVVIVKFATPGAASDAVKELDGRMWKEAGRVEASFWDGVTDFTVRDEVKEQKESEERQEQFGKWLEHQELPEELRLKVDNA